MKKCKYTKYSDSGHGWVKVKRSELVALAILDKISKYSYQRGDYVYLEEDCDFGKFLKQKVLRGYAVTIVKKYSNKQSKIRNYHSFVN